LNLHSLAVTEKTVVLSLTKAFKQWSACACIFFFLMIKQVSFCPTTQFFLFFGLNQAIPTDNGTNLLISKNEDNRTFQLFLLPKDSKAVR